MNELWGPIYNAVSTFWSRYDIEETTESYTNLIVFVLEALDNLDIQYNWTPEGNNEIEQMIQQALTIIPLNEKYQDNEWDTAPYSYSIENIPEQVTKQIPGWGQNKPEFFQDPDFFRFNRNSSIFDKVSETLDKHVFKGDTPKPSIVNFIEEKIFSIFEKSYNFDPRPYVQLFLTGSLTTYQYSPTSDCDISVFIDWENWPTYPDPKQLRSALITLMVDKLDGVYLPGTQHPLQAFIVAPGIQPEDNFQEGLRSAWDFQTRDWLVPPDKERVHDVHVELPAMYIRAHQIAEKLSILIDTNPNAAIQLYNRLHRKRMKEGKRGDWTEANVIYKFLSHAGLFDRLRGLGIKIASWGIWDYPYAVEYYLELKQEGAPDDMARAKVGLFLLEHYGIPLEEADKVAEEIRREYMTNEDNFGVTMDEANNLWPDYFSKIAEIYDDDYNDYGIYEDPKPWELDWNLHRLEEDKDYASQYAMEYKKPKPTGMWYQQPQEDPARQILADTLNKADDFLERNYHLIRGTDFDAWVRQNVEAPALAAFKQIPEDIVTPNENYPEQWYDKNNFWKEMEPGGLFESTDDLYEWTSFWKIKILISNIENTPIPTNEIRQMTREISSYLNAGGMSILKALTKTKDAKQRLDKILRDYDNLLWRGMRGQIGGQSLEIQYMLGERGQILNWFKSNSYNIFDTLERVIGENNIQTAQGIIRNIFYYLDKLNRIQQGRNNNQLTLSKTAFSICQIYKPAYEDEIDAIPTSEPIPQHAEIPEPVHANIKTSEEEVPMTPNYFEGYKILEVDQDGMLISPSQRTEWPPGEKLVAENFNEHDSLRGVPGIHAVTETNFSELKTYASRNWVLAKVALWGPKMRIGRDENGTILGYRAPFAYPQVIYYSEYVHPDLAKKIGQLYQIEVYPLSEYGGNQFPDWLPEGSLDLGDGRRIAFSNDLWDNKNSLVFMAPEGSAKISYTIKNDEFIFNNLHSYDDYEGVDPTLDHNAKYIKKFVEYLEYGIDPGFTVERPKPPEEHEDIFIKDFEDATTFYTKAKEWWETGSEATWTTIIPNQDPTVYHYENFNPWPPDSDNIEPVEDQDEFGLPWYSPRDFSWVKFTQLVSWDLLIGEAFSELLRQDPQQIADVLQFTLRLKQEYQKQGIESSSYEGKSETAAITDQEFTSIIQGMAYRWQMIHFLQGQGREPYSEYEKAFIQIPWESFAALVKALGGQVPDMQAPQFDYETIENRDLNTIQPKEQIVPQNQIQPTQPPEFEQLPLGFSKTNWKEKYNYKKATGDKSCFSCGAFKNGLCKMFDAKVGADMTCDEWVKVYKKSNVDPMIVFWDNQGTLNLNHFDKISGEDWDPFGEYLDHNLIIYEGQEAGFISDNFRKLWAHSFLDKPLKQIYMWADGEILPIQGEPYRRRRTLKSKEAGDYGRDYRKSPDQGRTRDQWNKISEKAARLLADGKVQINTNNWTKDPVTGRIENHVQGTVEGDHGTYECELWRDDPSSNVVTRYNCDCPFGQVQWGRTRWWKGLNAAWCAHELALHWASQLGPGQAPPTEQTETEPPGPEPNPIPGQVNIQEGEESQTQAPSPEITETPANPGIQSVPQKPGQTPFGLPGAFSKELNWWENPDQADWQHGMCDTYAKALIDLYPHLRLGYADGGQHFFAHDDEFAYDSLGKHPLPYLGINGDFESSDLDQEPSDWFEFYPYGENATEEDYNRARALIPQQHPWLNQKTAAQTVFQNGDFVKVKPNLVLQGEDDQGNHHTIYGTDNRTGEVIYCDDQDCVAVFRLTGSEYADEGKWMTPFLIRVETTPDTLYKFKGKAFTAAKPDPYQMNLNAITQLNEEDLRAARDWLLDCFANQFGDDEEASFYFSGLPWQQIEKLIQKYYGGGIEQFIRDANPKVSAKPDPNQMIFEEPPPFCYIVIDVDYQEEINETWVLPEYLKNLPQTEEGESEYQSMGAVSHAVFSGQVDQEICDKFRRDWGLDHEESENNGGMLTEFGWLPCDMYTPHPMDWNTGGITPIFNITICIFDAEVQQEYSKNAAKQPNQLDWNNEEKFHRPVNYYRVLAYQYDADYHCPDCAAKRFGVDEDGWVPYDYKRDRDREGNPIHLVSNNDEWMQFNGEPEILACADCGKVLDTYEPYLEDKSSAKPDPFQISFSDRRIKVWTAEGYYDYDAGDFIIEDSYSEEFTFNEADTFIDEDPIEMAAEFLIDRNLTEPSSAPFHPGTWYMARSSEITDEKTEEVTAHLEGFSPEEEQRIYAIIMGPGYK